MTAPDGLDSVDRPALDGEVAPRRALEDVSTPRMVLLQVVLGVVLLVAWQLMAGRVIDEFMISTPTAVIGRLWEWIATGSILVFEHEIAMEKEEIRLMPELEQEELSLLYQAKGIPEAQAQALAAQIMLDPARALEEQVREELKIGEATSTGGCSMGSIWTLP